MFGRPGHFAKQHGHYGLRARRKNEKELQEPTRKQKKKLPEKVARKSATLADHANWSYGHFWRRRPSYQSGAARRITRACWTFWGAYWPGVDWHRSSLSSGSTRGGRPVGGIPQHGLKEEPPTLPNASAGFSGRPRPQKTVPLGGLSTPLAATSGETEVASNQPKRIHHADRSPPQFGGRSSWRRLRRLRQRQNRRHKLDADRIHGGVPRSGCRLFPVPVQLIGFDQHLRGQLKVVREAPNHLQCQRTCTV